jgi:hypothetical protein
LSFGAPETAQVASPDESSVSCATNAFSTLQAATTDSAEAFGSESFELSNMTATAGGFGMQLGTISSPGQMSAIGGSYAAIGNAAEAGPQGRFEAVTSPSVPEPSTWALMLSGLVALLIRSRVRRARS